MNISVNFSIDQIITDTAQTTPIRTLLKCDDTLDSLITVYINPDLLLAR